jgi:hypothetical protein
MKELYNELLERETYLKGIEQTEQVQTRLSELMLVIVRVQQLISPIFVGSAQVDCLDYSQGYDRCEKQCKRCEDL